MSDRDTRRPVHSPATASRVFSGEAVVITPGDNAVRMFNFVGSRVWELMDGRRTLDEIFEALVDEYEVDMDVARESVGRFVEQLHEKRLIEFVGPDPGAS